MKNAVILLSNFHMWCQEVVKFSLEFLFIETFTVIESFDESFDENYTTSWHHTWKFDKKIISNSRYRYIENSIFCRWYDTIYRYRIDISIPSIYRSITNVLLCVQIAVTHSSARCYFSTQISTDRFVNYTLGQNKLCQPQFFFVFFIFLFVLIHRRSVGVEKQ